jgi:uncharacterized 2Fe-2S/4Fe-4S cluster protein (DUF4445 family)
MNALGVFAGGARQVQIVPEKGIVFSRADASALAQAKGANYSGQWILLRRLGVDPSQLARLYLAGGFARYIDVANAIAIGMIPNIPLERVCKLGNAAVEGATAMLLDRGRRDAAERLARRIMHVELETDPEFFDTFVEGCLFESMEPALLPAEAHR